MEAILGDITGRGEVAEGMVWEDRLMQALCYGEGEVRVGRSGMN